MQNKQFRKKHSLSQKIGSVLENLHRFTESYKFSVLHFLFMYVILLQGNLAMTFGFT